MVLSQFNPGQGILGLSHWPGFWEFLFHNKREINCGGEDLNETQLDLRRFETRNKMTLDVNFVTEAEKRENSHIPCTIISTFVQLSVLYFHFLVCCSNAFIKSSKLWRVSGRDTAQFFRKIPQFVNVQSLPPSNTFFIYVCPRHTFIYIQMEMKIWLFKVIWFKEKVWTFMDQKKRRKYNTLFLSSVDWKKTDTDLLKTFNLFFVQTSLS